MSTATTLGTDTGREPASAPGRSTAWWVRRWAYALIALHLAVRAWVTFPSYFFQDDYAHLELARRLGLSPDYLVRDYGGHLEPGQYVVIWLVSHLVDVAFWPAAVCILVLQLAASVLTYRVVRELVGDVPVLLVPLAVYLFTPLSLAWATWWAAALQTLSLQVAMLGVLLCVVRLHRTGERRWAVWSVVAHVLGLLFWEKAALILPTALALSVLVLAPPTSWRTRLGVLRQRWRFWGVHGAVLAAYVAVYLSVVDSPADGSGRIAVPTLVGQTLGRMYVPGIFGGPWHADGAENTLYPYAATPTAVLTWVLLAALVAASVAVRGRRAWSAWVLLAGYLAMDLVLLGLGRPEWVGLLARDPRYVADALPITAIAIAVAFAGPDPDRPRSRGRVLLEQRLTLPVALNVVAVLVLSCLVTTAELAPVAQHEYSRNYALGVLRQLEEHPERSVVSTATPYLVSARTDVRQMMDAIGADVELDRPATQMWVFDGIATMREMDLLAAEPVTTGPEAGCGWEVDDTWTGLGSLSPSSDPVRVLRLTYEAGGPGELAVRVGEQEQRLSIPAGLGRAFFVVPTGGGPLSARVDGTVGTCVVDRADGPPWVAQ